jgi:hypothetical protein
MGKKLMCTFAAVAASFLLCAMSAWAGHGHWHEHGRHYAYGHNGSGVSRGRSHGPGESPSSDVESGQAGEPPASNRGGATRGLNRANDVAGEHGDWGRSNAESHGRH